MNGLGVAIINRWEMEFAEPPRLLPMVEVRFHQQLEPRAFRTYASCFSVHNQGLTNEHDSGTPVTF
jgi:hypothetical protein